MYFTRILQIASASSRLNTGSLSSMHSTEVSEVHVAFSTICSINLILIPLEKLVLPTNVLPEPERDNLKACSSSCSFALTSG